MTKEEIKKVIIENKGLLEKYKIKSISLFGSYVRGEQKEESDIDLLVDFKANSYENYINLVFGLEDIFMKKATVVTPNGLSPYIRPYVLRGAEKIEG